MPRKRRNEYLTDKGLPWPRVEGPIATDWTVSTTYTAPSGRILTPGTEISIRGARGRYRFVKHVARPNGVEWIDVWGGPGKEEHFRAFRPDRIRTVHRLNRTGKNLLAERKAARRAAA
jgi:hypothetical protein